jgi:hypothetical protein
LDGLCRPSGLPRAGGRRRGEPPQGLGPGLRGRLAPFHQGRDLDHRRALSLRRVHSGLVLDPPDHGLGRADRLVHRRPHPVRGPGRRKEDPTGPRPHSRPAGAFGRVEFRQSLQQVLRARGEHDVDRARADRARRGGCPRRPPGRRGRPSLHRPGPGRRHQHGVPDLGLAGAEELPVRRRPRGR